MPQMLSTWTLWATQRVAGHTRSHVVCFPLHGGLESQQGHGPRSFGRHCHSDEIETDLSCRARIAQIDYLPGNSHF